MEKETTPSHLRPFDIEKAKNGAKVVTRSGIVAQILTYDFKLETGEEIMIVMISDYPNRYNQKGYPIENDCIWNGQRDLFLLPNMREGWVNVYSKGLTCNPSTGGTIYNTKEEAESDIYTQMSPIATARIEWEE